MGQENELGRTLMPSGNAGAQRIGWVDVAKGVGIILIVIGHANRSIDRSSLLVWTDALETLDTVLYAFHVPLFFLLAGVSAALARPGWRNGLRSLTLGIVVPYLIWSIIWILCKSLLPGGIINLPLRLSDMWQILWMPVDHFWFLYHLALIRIIWLMAENWLDKNAQKVLLVGLLIASHGLRLLDEDTKFVAHFMENTAFFGVGLLLWHPLIKGVGHLGVMALVSLAAFAGLLVMRTMGEIQLLSFATSLAGVLTVIFAIACFDKSSQGMVRHGLARIGQLSLVIFLLHVFAIGLVRFLLTKTGYLGNEALLIGGTVAGVALPFAAYNVVHWISTLSGRPILTWIGWGQWRQRAVVSIA